MCLGFAKVLHRFGIPIMTENKAHLAKFKGHVLRVHFRMPDAAYSADERKFQAVLIIAEDFPKLYTLLKAIHAPFVPQLIMSIMTTRTHHMFAGTSVCSRQILHRQELLSSSP
jgi:hypothetical protein